MLSLSRAAPEEPCILYSLPMSPAKAGCLGTHGKQAIRQDPKEETGERSPWVPQDEAGGNSLTPCLKLISAHRGSVRDARVLQHRQGKTVSEKWSKNSESSTASWPVHVFTPPPHGPSLFLVGKDVPFAAFLLLHEDRGPKMVVRSRH